MTDLAVIEQKESLRSIMHSEAVLTRFTEVLGDKIMANSYAQSVMIAVGENDDLKKCDVNSIIGSALRAATLRLSVDKSTGQAYLVPFGKKATLIVGYKGLYQMAIRTGKYRFINLIEVHQDDELVENIMTGNYELRRNGTAFVPANYKSDSPIIGYLLYFKLNSGLEKSFYMTSAQCAEHGAQYSKTFNYSSSLWKTNPQVMYKKTVIRLGLLRWGYLDPYDTIALSEIDEQENEIAGEYVAVDDSLPDPEISPEQAMKDLGFDIEPKQPDKPAAMTYEQACAVKSSDGSLYGSTTDKELTGHRIGLTKALNKPDIAPEQQSEYLNKLEAIKVLLAVPESERLIRAGQEELPAA